MDNYGSLRLVLGYPHG